MLKKRNLFLTLLLALSLMVSSTSFAIASTTPSVKSQGVTQFSYNSTNHPTPWITDKEAVKQREDKITKGLADIYARTHDWKAVDNFLKSQGMEVVVPNGIAQKDSVNSDVSYYSPSVYYDPGTGKYSINGSWQWKKNSSGIPIWYYDYSFPGNVGGSDAAGVWLSNPAGITLDSNIYLVTYDSNRGSYTTSTAWDWNEYGAVFKLQDYSWYDSSLSWGENYNWDSGTVVLWTTVAGSGSTYLKTYLAHDWYAPEISSASIGPSGISFTLQDTTKSWQGTSSPYTWYR